MANLQAIGPYFPNVPHTRLTTGDTNDQVSVTGKGTYLNGIYVSNLSANPVFIKIYDKATAPAVASDTPVVTLGPFATLTGQAIPLPNSITLLNGLAYVVSKLAPDTDNTWQATVRVHLDFVTG